MSSVRVGWLADRPAYTGGAELTQAEFRMAAPEGVEIVDCPPGAVAKDCDVYAVHNCLSYSVKDLKALERPRKPVFKYWNDVGNWYPLDVREWFSKNTVEICCSALQAAHMGLDAFGKRTAHIRCWYKGPGVVLIPPPVDLEPFERAAASVNGNRAGSVSVAQWRLPNKGADAVVEWSAQNREPVDFYGGGQCAPEGSRQIAYRGMPALLARYRRFVFLPTVIEPFGRCVVEAWAAGCELAVNRLVGALEWIERNPDGITTAAEDYWRLLVG